MNKTQAALLGIIGLTLLWINAGLWVTVGVFFMLWGNNIGQRPRRRGLAYIVVEDDDLCSSKYLNGWLCSQCGHDNADEDSPCADKTQCGRCGARRPE